MSMENLREAFHILQDNPHKQDFSGGISADTIKKAEKKLRINFPKTYKNFLQKLGCGGVGNSEIYGIIKEGNYLDTEIPFVSIPDIVWSTLEWHKDFGHPLALPIIYNLGEGTLYCLDTSQMNKSGECPVVAWPLGGYETTPILEVIAEDFGKFFLDMVKRELEE